MRSPETAWRRGGGRQAAERIGFPPGAAVPQGLFAVALYLSSALAVCAMPDESLSPLAILNELRGFRQMGSVLYVAAHPDDENTQLLADLARGRHYRTAYMSLTRGDGGQNVIGAELDEELGVIRTQELLAARRIDGARQFFSRAIDFGFSKDYSETLSIWNRQEVLSDIVLVIRQFRPDIVVTRFSPEPGRTHGHHTASAVLALEAFRLAGDTNAFPEQLGVLQPWQPRRILHNSWRGFGRGAQTETNPGVLQIQVGGIDLLSGESLGALAARSRSMHKSQGFGNFGGYGGDGPRSESFQLLEGEPATNDILNGVDTSWRRVPGGEDIDRLSAAIEAKFDTNNPGASVPALLDLRRKLAELAVDPVVAEKRAQLDRILQSCLGLSVETLVSQGEIVPGERVEMRHSVAVRSGLPVKWAGVRREGKELSSTAGGMPAAKATTLQAPMDAILSQPYWLRADRTKGMFQVADSSLLGRPENPPAFPIEHIFVVGGQELIVADEPVWATTNSSGRAAKQPLQVIAPVSLGFDSDVELFVPGATRRVTVGLTASRPGVGGTVQLEAGAGWKIEPAKREFRLKEGGVREQFRFDITAPDRSEATRLVASALVKGRRYAVRRVVIEYDHIPRQLLQAPARVKAVSLDLAIGGKAIGYVPGAGDRVAESLRQMGCAVTELQAADLSERLRKLDAIVVGVRALNVREDLVSKMPVLFEYVNQGGTLVMQYNTANGLKTERLAPYDLHLSNNRVTDETAAVDFLAPNHPVLNQPNRITASDFAGWVQERGLYFPDRWGEEFAPILACHDAGEEALKGGLLVARHGRGYFVYTSLSWFRQLPAGVPGAYRLFANVVSLKSNGNSEGTQ